MSQYIKPSAMFITAVGNPAIGGCTTDGEELEILGDIFGIDNWDTAFATGESCQVEYPIEEYCKFTSVANGTASKILGS